jgi:hypothetical protein
MWSCTETMLIKWVITEVCDPKHRSLQTSRDQYPWEDTLTNKRPTWCGYVTRLKRLPEVLKHETKMKIPMRRTMVKIRTMSCEWHRTEEKKKHERKLMMMILWDRETNEQDWLLDDPHKEEYIKLTFILDKCNLNLWKYKTGAARLTLYNMLHTFIHLLLSVRHNNHFPRL